MRVPKTFQGFFKGTLENPQISRQVRGQSFQGQGIKFKGKLGIMIQGLFKGNPRKFSIFKSTSRETFSRILPSLILSLPFEKKGAHLYWAIFPEKSGGPKALFNLNWQGK